MKCFTWLLMACCGAVASSDAAADPPAASAATPAAATDPVRPWQLEIDFGQRSNGEVSILEGQLFVGYTPSWNLGHAAWMPFVAAGLHASFGQATVNEPLLGPGRTVSGDRYAVGPELRLGLAGKSGGLDHYLYFAVAPLYLDSVIPPKRLPEADGTFGIRSALGFGYPAKWGWILRDEAFGHCTGGPPCGILLFFYPVGLLVPNHVELVLENVAGTSARFGGTIGYSF